MDIVWQAEDSLREKKVESDLKDLLKTMVAFANSVAPGDIAQIYIGEKDDGTVQGVKSTDSIQKAVQKEAEKIYPEIYFRSEVYERAIQDDVKSILVLEDDAVLTKTFAKDVADFLANVPDDWQCLMLGGQPVNSQLIPVVPGVVRAGGGGGIQRTHGYALSGHEAMKALYRTWANSAVHCDWVMGPCMAKFNTYAPDPFIVGQADGRSDISGAFNPAKFWRSPNGYESVVVLNAPRAVMEALREKGWHAGYTRDKETGIDVGLRDLFADTKLTLSERNAKLKNWIDIIQWEVASMTNPAFCTVWHPAANAETVRLLTKGKVVEIAAETVEEALSQLPTDIHTPACILIRVVLLRASRKVMDALREQGWHTGYWRDEITGHDNGLRRLFGSTTDQARRSAGLGEIARLLHDEVEKIPGGVVTLWHDEITADMVQSEEIEVIEINATTPEDAIASLNKSNYAKTS